MNLSAKIKFVQYCLTRGISYRDIGQIMNVTPQRISAFVSKHQIWTKHGVKIHARMLERARKKYQDLLIS